MGENIGAAARAMWNFGLRDIRLVDPRDGWPNPKAIAMASGAAGLLEDARRFQSTPDAVADCAEVYATTARPREMTKPVLSPAEAAQRMRARIRAGQRAAVLLGPERTGLENADVALADVIVTADTNPAFGSINLAQAALLMAYEWRRSAGAPPAPAPEPLAEAGMVTGLIEHLTGALEEAGYFWPAEKADAMRLHLQNILRRAPLTIHDVSILRGAVRALHEGRKRGGRKPAAQAQDMAALRAGIDAVDRDLIALFAERQAHIERAAELKAANGLPANIPQRVEEVAGAARKAAEAAGLDGPFFEAFWRSLIDRAIALEERRLAEGGATRDARRG
jgi:tRNA/rRNA methyltransferase